MLKTTTFRPELHDADVWIFDLDNTLYPAHCNLFHQVDQKMGNYISELLNIPFADARRLQKEYYREYGTTLNGLMQNHGIAPESFLDFVHDIDYSPIQRNQTLIDAINALPGRRLVFTNGTVPHANAVLERLDLQHAFESVFDIIASDYIPKPNPEPYDAFLEKEGIDPGRAVFFEDIARNLEHPAKLGMQTVWIKEDHEWAAGEQADDDHIHHITPDLPTWLAGFIAETKGIRS